MRDTIVEAAKSSLLRAGLAAWTIDAVAREAGCAKGLIHYHFGSKTGLLVAVGKAMKADRLARRSAAFSHVGAGALDALWRVLAQEVQTGACAAWLALVTVKEPEVRQALAPTAEEISQVVDAATGALELGEQPFETVQALLEAVDGIQLALLMGATPESARESYDRFWLAVL